MNKKITERWEEINTIVESIKLDILKNANENVSAGIRARKGLRDLKRLSADLIRVSIEEDKKTVEKRKKRREIKKMLDAKGIKY